MVVHAYYPIAEPRVQREAAAARDAGYEVTVLSLRAAGEPRSEEVDGIHVYRMPVSHRRGAKLPALLLEYLAFCAVVSVWLARRSLRQPFAIVHIHNPPDFLVVAGLVPRMLGSRLVLDIHDLSSHIFGARVGGASGRLAPWLLVALERLAGRIAHAVITVHGAYREELVRHGIPAGRIEVVMNSVDDAVLERARTVEPLMRLAGAFTIAYHGTITPWYGTDLIIEATALLSKQNRDVNAIILGDGDQVPHLRELAQLRGVSGSICLSGRYVAIDVALATIAQASCGVIPNRPSQINRFALSSKLFEYVALGIPVAVARLETLAAHFAPQEVTFFAPGSAEALAEALAWIHDHPDEARAKALRAQVRMEEYAWPRNRDRLQQIYAAIQPEQKN